MAGTNTTPSKMNRLGFQYYDDVDHYDDVSLAFWLPKLKEAGTRWIVLPIAETAEIPENFIRRLVQAGIEPLIRIGYSLKNPPTLEIFRERIAYYQSLGVHLVQFFHNPNMKASWNAASWQKANLIERFVAMFRSYAKICVDLKVIPVFPTLTPGGDYSDLAFLSESLRLMKTEGNALISNLFLAADAGFQEHVSDWGKGGPLVEEGRLKLQVDGQDQRGFHIYEWYNAVVMAILGRSIPMLLLEVGRWSSATGPFDMIPTQSKKQQHELLKRIQGSVANVEDQLPAYVIAANFYKLPSDALVSAQGALAAVETKNVVEMLKKGLSSGFALTEPPAGKTIRSAKTVGEELDSLVTALLHRLFPDWIQTDTSIVRQLITKVIKLIRSAVASIRRRIGTEGYFLIPDLGNELDAAQEQLIDLFVKSSNVRVGHNISEAIGSGKVILLEDTSLYPSNMIQLLQRNQCTIRTLSVANQDR